MHTDGNGPPIAPAPVTVFNSFLESFFRFFIIQNVFIFLFFYIKLFGYRLFYSSKMRYKIFNAKERLISGGVFYVSEAV
ncbi:hypothetical protein D9M72_579960 [compost metagenome]